MTIEVHEQLDGLNSLPKRIQGAFRAASNAAKVWSLDARGEFVESHLSGNPVRRISGALERSFQPVWSKGEGSFRAGVEFADPMRGPEGSFPNYAHLLEEGGTVTPKRGRLLAWPVQGGPAVTAGGMPRYSGPRSFPGKLFFWRSGSGKMFLAQTNPGKGKRGHGPGLELVYNLAPSVTITARMGFRAWGRTAQQKGRGLILEAFLGGIAA